MKKTIFIKIFTGYVLIIALMTGGVSILSFRIVKHHHIETLTGHLEKLAIVTGHSIQELYARREQASLDRMIKKLGPEIGTRITIIDQNGTVLADSEGDPLDMENHSSRQEVTQALGGSVGVSQRYSTTLKNDMLYVAVPLTQAGSVDGVVRMSCPASDIQHWLSQLKVQIVQIALLVILLAVICSLLVARKLSAPIAQLSRASRQIAAGDFNVRVFVDSRDEVQDFAVSFNNMTEKIRELFDEVSLQQEQLKL